MVMSQTDVYSKIVRWSKLCRIGQEVHRLIQKCIIVSPTVSSRALPQFSSPVDL